MSTLLGTAFNNSPNNLETTSSGNIYCFIHDTTQTTLLIFKSTNGGSSFSPLSSVSGATITGTAGAGITGLGSVIDSTDKIHFAIATGTSGTVRDICYNIFDTSNDTWGPWEQAADYVTFPTSNRGCCIAVDSSNKPHILYVDYVVSNLQVKYTNKVSGSWSAPVTIDAVPTTNYRHTKILAVGDVMEVEYGKSTIVPIYMAQQTRSASGSWSGEVVWSNQSMAVGKGTIIRTSNGNVYRYGALLSSPYTLYENNTAVLSGTVDVFPSYAWGAAAVGNTRYVFYMDQSDRYIKYIKNNGSGWTSPATLETGTNTAVNVEYKYQNYYVPTGKLYYVFTNTSNEARFGILTLGSSTTSKSAYVKGAFDFEIEWAVVSGAFTPIAISNKSAYLKGQDYSNSSKTAYLHGSLSTSESAASYLAGSSLSISSKSAYLYGHTIIDSKKAYIAGKQVVVSKLPSYICGFDQPGYTYLWVTIVEDVQIWDTISTHSVALDDTVLDDVEVDTKLIEDIEIDSYFIESTSTGDTQNG